MVDQDDLDAALRNVLPAIGVALVAALTVVAIRTAGVHATPGARGDWLRVVLAVLLALIAVPWIFALLGFYAPDPIYADEPSPDEPIAAVHLGGHHGFYGVLIALTGLALSRALPSFRDRRLAAASSAVLALAARLRRRERPSGCDARANLEARDDRVEASERRPPQPELGLARDPSRGGRASRSSGSAASDQLGTRGRRSACAAAAAAGLRRRLPPREPRRVFFFLGVPSSAAASSPFAASTLGSAPRSAVGRWIFGVTGSGSSGAGRGGVLRHRVRRHRGRGLLAAVATAPRAAARALLLRRRRLFPRPPRPLLLGHRLHRCLRLLRFLCGLFGDFSRGRLGDLS